MRWNPLAQEHIMALVEQVVPEPFRKIALEGLQTDAERFAQQRNAAEIEDRDLTQAVAQAPDFIQAALHDALAQMGIHVEQPS